ncbi:MAG: ParB/RepB/Spo0J family partition protein [Angelakisella sp.]
MKIDLSAQKPRQQTTAADLSALLGGQVNNAVVRQLPLDLLTAYPNQPFKPYTDEKLARLTEDIRANGVLSPIIVRPKGERYEVLAGHNRWNASRRAGLTTIPAMVQEVDDDTAALIMVNTNLNQRDQLSSSEKAFAYRVQLEAMKRKAGRPQNNVSQVGTQKRSDQEMAELLGESRNQIQRYIRLTYLIPDLLAQVDSSDLPMIPAVSLSYLPAEEQEMVLRVSADCERKISVIQAEQLKKAAGQLSEAAIAAVLLPVRRWNAQQEFVNQSRAAIPGSASVEDIAAVLALIQDYFKQKERSA